jgi:hypothetical protein
MKNIFLLITLAAMSCSTDNVDSPENNLSGYYEITSIQSDVSVDLNNDGEKSKDIFSEIASTYHTLDGNPVSFYDFSSHSSLLEVRPLKNTTNDAKLISFNLPAQEIDYLTNGTPYLMFYIQNIHLYRYEFIENSNTIKLIDSNPDFNDNVNFNSLELTGNNDLKLKFTNLTFDFVELDWIETNMTAIFKKVQ